MRRSTSPPSRQARQRCPRARIVLCRSRAADTDAAHDDPVDGDRNPAAEDDEAAAGCGVESEQFAAGRGEAGELSGGDAIRHRGECLVHRQRGPGDLGTVHAAERDQVSAGVHHRGRDENGVPLCFGVGGGDHAQRGGQLDRHGSEHTVRATTQGVGRVRRFPGPRSGYGWLDDGAVQGR